MPSLMDIPRELRDEICTEVLLTRSTPPNLDEPFDSLIESRVRYEKPELRASSREVLYDPQNPATNMRSLLLVNQQLYRETLSNIRHLSRTPICEMDLILADEVVLLPTWLFVPPRHTTAFDTINVTFRIAGAFRRIERYQLRKIFPTFRDGSDGHWGIGWQLYAVLERFTRAGSGGETESPDTDLHVTAKRICIDVQTPAGIEEKCFVAPRNRRKSWRKAMAGVQVHANSDVLDPKYLVHFVKHHLNGLLTGIGRERFRCAQRLYEHVDEVVLCRDGVEVTKWDVAKCLKKRELAENICDSAEDLRVYKQKTWNLRRSRHLKVYED